MLFTGDTLFNGSVGRTDLPGGSMDVLTRSIRERLAILPESTKVYPGHGPSSTIAIELGEVSYYTTHFYMLFAVGLMVFIITFIINLISDVVFHKHTKVQA